MSGVPFTALATRHEEYLRIVSRAWLRLIGWLGLVALLGPHLPATVALVACCTGGVPDRHAEPRTSGTVAATGCKHCAKKALARARAAPASALRPACPGSRPCCPLCPVPGGCALCNLTKVPCLVPPLVFPAADPLLGGTTCDPAPLYASPFCGRLTPPPKV